MIHLRCSRLPLFLSCSQSASPGLAVESPDRDAADLGTGIHEAIAGWIKAERPNQEDCVDIAARLGLDLAELQAGAAMAWLAWTKLEGFFPRPQVERTMGYAEKLNEITLTGTADVLSSVEADVLGDTECRILDWKTGWGAASGNPDAQLKGYAFLASERYPQAQRIGVCVLRTREFSADWTYYTREELSHFWQGITARIRETVYRPGRHCGQCPRGADCEAKTELIRQSLVLVDTAAKEGALRMLSRKPAERAKQLEEILAAARFVGRASELVQDLIRAEVEAAGGQLGNLSLKSYEPKEIVLPAALPILTEALGDELQPLLKVSKKEVEKAVKARFPRGAKGEAVKQLMGRLEDAGALKIESFTKLEIKAPKEAPQLEVVSND